MGVLSSSITLWIADCVDSFKNSLLRPTSFVLPPEILLIRTSGLDLLEEEVVVCAVGALVGTSAALVLVFFCESVVSLAVCVLGACWAAL